MAIPSADLAAIFPEFFTPTGERRPSMAGVRDWAVKRLRELEFEGDADALGMYVDALAESNVEHDNGDLSKLREEASRELVDFLGSPGSKAFVNELVAHLERQRVKERAKEAAQKPPPPSPPQVKPEPKQEDTPAAPPAAPAPAPAHVKSEQRAVRIERNDRNLNRNERVERGGRNERRDRGDRNERHERSERHDRHDRHERNDRNERVDRNDRSGRRRKRRSRSAGSRGSQERNGPRNERPNVMDRLREPLGDRKRRGRSRSRSVEPQKPPGRDRMRDRQFGRGERDRRERVERDRAEFERPRGQRPMDLRDQLQGKRRVRDDGNPDREMRGSGPNPPLKRPRDDSRGDMGRGAFKPNRGDSRRSPEHGPSPQSQHAQPPGPPGFPFMHPQMLMAMGAQPGGPPPDPALFASMFAAHAQSMQPPARGGMGGRRGRGGRREQNDRPTQLAKSTLFVANVPEDKCNFGDLNNYFSKFGSLSNIRLLPSNRALLEFSTRQQAQAALNSVDAVFGNRHVKVTWARENEGGDDGGRGRRGAVNGASHQENERPPEEETEDPEAELQRKRQEIKEARAAEMKQKVERRAAYDGAINEQKELFRKLESGGMNVEQKKGLLKRLQELSGVIAKVDEATKKRPVSAPVPATHPWKRQRTLPKRGGGSYSLDNRPKVIRILGANAGISPDAAAAIFRDTQRAELHGSAWILHFSTRAAAESAIRAVRVLKRGFGLGATAQIIHPSQIGQSPPQQQQPIGFQPSVSSGFNAKPQAPVPAQSMGFPPPTSMGFNTQPRPQMPAQSMGFPPPASMGFNTKPQPPMPAHSMGFQAKTEPSIGFPMPVFQPKPQQPMPPQSSQAQVKEEQMPATSGDPFAPL